ncbi:UV radiation resistance protein and autophagy-related subunit 14-domain-containing protein, partial [Aspergillus ambiguus]|uniref:Atg14 domain-containing protein n=1 Tax=Aspergillus ambiguus TaxID=176160 RepID=UPI003CCE3CCF
MSCHVCAQAPSSRTRYFCPTCARNQLYQLRLQHATVLLEKESIGKQIEDASTSGNPSRTPERSATNRIESQEVNPNILILQTITNEKAKSSARITLLAKQIESLRLEIKDKQLDISQRRLVSAQRRSDAESATYQIAEREATTLAGIQNSTKRTDHLWHSLHSKTAEDRIFLCREAANIYGLRQKTKKKEGQIKEIHTIGGVPIIDLRDLNGAPPSQISTSLDHVAHLLVLVSNYLSLRLPAEITLPHRNYATPTIYPPSGSYLSRDNASAPQMSQPAPSSPGASRTTDSRSHFPRPRPLSIDRSLPRLAREDPAAYALFLEGAALLAWDVSWICRTQGLNLASDSWEEVCDIGKNMWQLLVAPPAPASTLMRAFAGRDIQTKMKLAKDSPKTTIQRTKSFPMMGHYSHGTVHSFLGASEGTEFIRTWRLPSPTKIVDKLKACLLGEMASAEWELLEEKEWDDASHEEPTAATEGHDPSDRTSRPYSDGRQHGSHAAKFDQTPAPISARSEQDSDPVESSNHTNNTRRLKGTSGWTKLRN